MSVLVVGIIKLLLLPLLLPLLPLASPEHCGQPSPKKYATNCLNSPTNITYSSYFVCRRRRQRLTLYARRFHVPKLFACVKIKNFSFAFLWLFLCHVCVAFICYLTLVNSSLLPLATSRSVLSLCFSPVSIILSLSLSPYLCLCPRVVKYVIFPLSQLFSQGQFVTVCAGVCVCAHTWPAWVSLAASIR